MVHPIDNMTLDDARERRGYLNKNRSLLFLFVYKVGPIHACVEEGKNGRVKRSSNCILKLTQQQKPVILGNEYMIIKEGYFVLSPPHFSLFVCSPVYRRPFPSEKIRASSSQKAGGGGGCLYTSYLCAFLLRLRLHLSGCFKTLRFRKNTRPLVAYSNLFRPKRLNAKYAYRACAV